MIIMHKGDQNMSAHTIAAVFPGQGTQRAGMGKDFFDTIPASRDTYEEASQTLGWDVGEMCFGEDDRINLTEYAQPCILTTEISMLRGLEEKHGFSPSYFGGHSLGEYTAMVASGAMPFSEAIKIVHARGQLMQQASPKGEGGMAAIISENLDLDLILNSLVHLPMDVANINSNNQVVISGRADSMEMAKIRIEEAINSDSPPRFVPLNVSAPFHSRFMESIKDIFRDLLNSISQKINPANAKNVTSNFTGVFHSGCCDTIIDKLVSQLSGPVKWQDNMKNLSAKADHIYEIGPNRPLRRFFSSMGIRCTSITTLAAADREFLKGN